MPVSPQQLRDLRFDERTHGYDKHQVDQLIARVADAMEELQQRLARAEAGVPTGDRLDLTPEHPERGHGSPPGRLVAQVAQLTARRDHLSGVLERLEADLAARRQQVAMVVAQLNAVLDDPDGWGAIGTAEPADVSGVAVEAESPVEAGSGPRDARVAVAPMAAGGPLIPGCTLDDSDDDDGGPPTQLTPVVRAPGGALDDLDLDLDLDLDGDGDEDEDWRDAVEPDVDLREPSSSDGDGAVRGAEEGRLDGRPSPPMRPAWADSVPSMATAGAGRSVLGRADADDGRDSEAMERFFAGSGQDRRGWRFRRRS